jgi:tetratricopeptide (TPR) repeat protein
MRRQLLVSFLLVTAVAAVYWPVHSYPFLLLDDPGYVVDNPCVRRGLTREGLVYAFTGTTVGNWHPVTMLSHMLDCQFFGVEAGWHHLVNLALHAANTLLLFIALRRMTGAFWRSALVAALFGLHPLHVESVAWVSERKDVLSTFFFMLTLLAYCHYVQRPTILRYTAVFALLALGLMSKPMLVTAPFVLLLLDYWPLGRMRLPRIGGRRSEVGDQRSEVSQREDPSGNLPSPPGRGAGGEGGLQSVETENREADTAEPSDEATAEAEQPPADGSGKLPLSRLIVEKIPLLVLVAASAVRTFLVQQHSGATGMLGQVPLGSRLGNVLYSYGQYLEKTFWPYPLAAIYPYSNRKLWDVNVLIVGLALAAISVAAVRLSKIRPFLLVGWCWYLGTLVPVIGLVQVGVQSMADRYSYIPLIGIFIIAAWGAAEFTEQWPAGTKAVAAAAMLAVCGWFAWRQVATWSSSEVLYSHAVNADPYNYFARNGLGMVYWKDGRLDAAQEQFEAILAIEANRAVRVQGGFEPAHRALGLLLAVRHQPKKALEQLDEAIKTRGQQPEPLRNKAWILATYADPESRDGNVRDGKKAVELAELALRESGGKQPEYWDTLAAAQAESGDFTAAVETEEKALDQARSMRADDLIPGIQQRLKLFKSGMRYHAKAEHPARR